MRILYLDCFAGISGDMFIGAMLDWGFPLDVLKTELGKLDLAGYSVSSRRLVKQNLAATKFDCIESPHPVKVKTHPQRGYAEIVRLIESSRMSSFVKERATRVFKRIGEAEAKIHDVPLDNIHFHEVGAVDSIVDVVGACVALEWLKPERVMASPPPLGTGFVETAHGTFPVPAPATLEILRGVPTRQTNIAQELVTPTGAALLAEFCDCFGSLPPITIEKIGYGAGARELEKTPNVLRAVTGVTADVPGGETDLISLLECNVDDMNPELLGGFMEQVLEAGALEVFFTAVQMKKNRPGTLVTVLCEPGGAEKFVEMLLKHTTSFGVRITEARRRKLKRHTVTVPTRYGEIECKIGSLGDSIITRSPEFESCKRAAAAHGASVKDVYAAAVRAAEELP
jgi:hypothetical protein